MPDHRVRTTALSFAWALVACHRGGAEASVEPDQSAPVVAESEHSSAVTLAITVVPQLEAFVVQDWRFEPGGARLASTEHGDCTIWDVASGRLIRTFEDEMGPCEEWAPVVDFSALGGGERSADEALALDTTHGVAIVDAKSGQKLRELACSDCDQVDEISWSREGHQLALAWRDAARLEVWDADSATQLRTESIPIDGEVLDLQLGWTAGGATVAWVEVGAPIECDDEYSYDDNCEWDEAMQASVSRSLNRQILVSGEAGVELSLVGEQSDIGELQFDAEGHWAIWTRVYSERRMGTRTELNVAGIADGESGLGWTYADDYGYGYGGTSEREGAWRSDGATHWAMSISTLETVGYALEIDWGTFIIQPALGWRGGPLVDDLSDSSEVEVELFGVVGDELRFAGEHCLESCVALGLTPPPNCSFVDVATGHGSELLDCDGAAFLRNTGGLIPLPLDSVAMQWWWSKDGALAVHDGDNFMVLDAIAGAGGPPRTDVTEVFDGKLGPELNRLIVVTASGTELIDLSSGATILTLAKLEAEQAALSPTGDRLALLVAGQVRVVDVASGETVVSVAAAGEDLAFRQDGDALYFGRTQPEVVLDARTGEPLSDPALTMIDEAISRGGELDPSWRWIMDIETNELVRTIDGRGLRLDASGSWLPDTGQYSGDAPSFGFAFRIGDDPWLVPKYDAEDLARWLERSDLFEVFVAGQPIPPPRIEAAEFARLQAKAKD